MDFALSEEQIQIKNMARSFMRDEKSKEKQVENWIKNADKTKKFPVEFMKEDAKLGLLSIDIPEEYGGAGLDRASALLAFEEIAYVSVPFSLDILVHNSLSAFAINLAGRKDQKEKYLPRMASGEIFGCFANTEPDAGSDAKNIKTRAVKNGNKWLLNGKKRFCTNASASKVAVVFARTSERKAGSPGTTAFLSEVLAKTTATLEAEAFVQNLFFPFKSHLFPFLTARVLIFFASEPASGSVFAKQPKISPDAILGRYFSFWSFLPAKLIANAESELWTNISSEKGTET